MEEIENIKKMDSNIGNPDHRWYMVQVVTNKEEKAIQNLKFEIGSNNLERFVSDIVCPKEVKFFLRNKKKVKREKVMIPGYILMKMDPIAEINRIIKTTNYLKQIMGNDRGPEAITQVEVNRIFGNSEKSFSEIEFLVGETVNIIDGPFKSFTATIESINKEKNVAKLKVMVFGRPTMLDLKYEQIDKIKV